MIGETGPIFAVPPGLLLIAAGLALAFLRGRARDVVILLAPLLVLALTIAAPEGSRLSMDWFGLPLEPYRVDRLSRLFAMVFAVMAFAGGLYVLRQANRTELAAAFVYAGAAIGVVLAGDLVTVFIFWEVMAIGSTIIIWSAGGRAVAAAQRYAIIHIFGGALLMAGIAAHLGATGNLTFSAIGTGSIAGWMIFAGFLVNAGAPPLSAWLSDAYPEASWSGMVFLSAFTTKTAVYVLLRGFPGETLLIYLGLFMIFYGIIYALLENDMRRILAYSIVNQVGFMLTAIGIGTETALNGAAAHASVHIIYKALLLMSAGSVLLMTGRRKCSDLGGLFRTMPVTTLCAIVGALSISAFPLTSGYPAKALIADAAANAHLQMVWYLLAAASAGVFLHAGIKFPWFVFFQKDLGLRPKEPPLTMRAAMLVMAAICLAVGCAPQLLYAWLPYPVDAAPYATAHVVYQLQLLLFAGLAFFVTLRWLQRTETITLDADWLWRSGGFRLANLGIDRVAGAARILTQGCAHGARRMARAVYRHHGPEGILARSWPTGSMALWATLMLAAYLALYYL